MSAVSIVTPVAVRGAVPQSAHNLYVIAPCRLYDSRLADSNPKGPLTSGVIYSIDLPVGRCGLPADAEALVLDVTVITGNPPAGTAPRTGYISVFAGGASPPGFGLPFKEGLFRSLFLFTNRTTGAGPDLGVQGVTAIPTYHVALDLMGYTGGGTSTDIALDSTSVQENQPAGSLVGNFWTVDPDSDEIYTYELVTGAGDADNAMFQISGRQLLTGAVLDHEARSTFSIRVRSTEIGDAFLEKVFTITATDQNEAPTDLSLSSTTTAENLPIGSLVGTFSADDVDTSDSYTYSLVSDPLGPDNGSFQISGDQLLTNAVFDRETKASYSIAVQAEDSGGLTVRKQLTITVQDVNEPPVVSGGPFSLPENSPAGTVAGMALASDPDGGQTRTFMITGGNTGGAFTVNATTGQVTVANAAAVDYETNPTFNLTVQATDDGTPAQSGSATVVINLTDANDPPVVSGGPFSIAENSSNGTTLGAVTFTDQDAGQSHTFSIAAGNTGGAFSITPSSGSLRVANSTAVNFEANPVFNLTVRVTDNGSPGMSGTATVTVNLGNVPEVPVANDEGSAGSPYVETVGNTLLEVTATPAMPHPKIVFAGSVLANDFDPDGPTAFTVTLESSTPGAIVTLQNNGTFTYVPPAGFIGVDTFTYRITDPTSLFNTATVYVNVEGRVWYMKNDAAPGGLGRSMDPFDLLSEAEAASATSDTIYVFAGDGTTLGQSDGITLKSGQRLIGEAAPLIVPSVNINGVVGPALQPAGNRPKIENDDTPDAAGEDSGVSVPAISGNATSVEIRGLDIAGFDNAIDVTATGSKTASVTIRENVISGAGLQGIDVSAANTSRATLALQDNSVTAAGDGVSLSSSGAADIQLTVTGGAFRNVGGGALLANGDGSSRRMVTVSGVIFSDNHRGVRLLGSGNAALNFEVTGNTFLRHTLEPIEIATSPSATSAMQLVGTVSANTIGDGTPDSGSASSYGIAVDLEGEVDSILAITGNTVSRSELDGIYVQTRLDADAEVGRLDLTLRDNAVQTPDGSSYGTRVESRNTTLICLDIAGNSSAGGGGLEHFQTGQLDASTFLMERLSDGDGTPGELITDMAAVEAFLAGQNDAGSTADATQATPATGYTEADAACRKPAL